MSQPRINWYSGCSTAFFEPEEPDLGVGALKTDRRYALLTENGVREPKGADRQAYLDLGPHTVIPAENDVIGDATIVHIK